MDKRRGKQLKKEDLIGRENGSLICIDLVETIHKKNNWEYIILAKCKNCGKEFKMSWNSFRSTARKSCKSCKYCKGSYTIENRTNETGLTQHERHRLANIKNGAKRRNKKFLLTDIEAKILLNGSCIYCGKPNADGIDRIDSSKDYTLDNCVSCCKICNKMKNNYDLDFFKTHICKIYKMFNYEN